MNAAFLRYRHSAQLPLFNPIQKHDVAEDTKTGECAGSGNSALNAELMHQGPIPKLPSSPKRKVILVLSVSAGNGHVRAAEALVAQAGDSDIVHIDVMNHVPRLFRFLYTGMYSYLVGNFPHIWGWLYRLIERANPSDKIEATRRAFERKQSASLLKKIAEIRPDAIVCTHFLPAELLAHLPLAQQPTCPRWTLITDFDLHRIWIQPGTTGYLVANQEIKFRLCAAGIADNAIFVTGLPVMPVFTALPDRPTLAAELGFDPDRPTVLLMGGGVRVSGAKPIAKIATRVLAIDPKLQLIVLTGRNNFLKEHLTRLCASSATRVYFRAYSDKIERMMACADVIITKSGGLTSAECLTIGLPMIIHAPIPGQEERNADYLMEQGVALKASDPITVEFRVRTLLADRNRLVRMANHARAIAQPDAAINIVQIVAADLIRRGC